MVATANQVKNFMGQRKADVAGKNTPSRANGNPGPAVALGFLTPSC
jgi:hypothetical protein